MTGPPSGIPGTLNHLCAMFFSNCLWSGEALEYQGWESVNGEGLHLAIGKQSSLLGEDFPCYFDVTSVPCKGTPTPEIN